MMRMKHCFAWLFMAFTISACASVPLNMPKQYSQAIPISSDTVSGRDALSWAALHDGKSGFYPLPDGMDGLGARLALAARAEKTIDLQYFLMKDDNAGLVIRDALLKAADRGVHVRFLLDDVFTTAGDNNLLMLGQHPNIEMRLFNPISRKGIKDLNFVGNFSKMNRRMHNKSFTVDNALTIVGGRNIADEEFQLSKSTTFSDFDMLAIGPIAADISATFDQFWNFELAIPIEELFPPQPQGKLQSERLKFSQQAASVYNRIYKEALSTPVLQDLSSGKKTFFPASAKVFSDDPSKLIKAVGSDLKLVTELDTVLNQAKFETMFLNPYYIPRTDGVAYAKRLVDKGVRVVVMTNSLASNNHVAAYSAYASYRKRAIDAGVELYEVRANAGRELDGVNGPDTLTLHTKLILIDRRYLFVGSLNLDPRSFNINTEIGVLIDTQELVGEMAKQLDAVIPQVAYRVLRSKQGGLEWHGVVNGKSVVEFSEPQSSDWRKFKAWVAKLVPKGQM